MVTTKLISLWCFREVILDDVHSGTNILRFFLLSDTIKNEIITDINLESLLATRSSTILLQFYGALVILIEDFIMDLVFMIF